MTRSAAAPLLLVLLAVGCTSVGSEGTRSEVTLRVQPRPPAPGDSLTLVLENGSAGTVGYNLCTSALERRTGEAWATVPSERACTLELRTLPPGGEARFTFLLPADLTPGEYRAVTVIERMESGERGDVASEAFRVDG